ASSRSRAVQAMSHRHRKLTLGSRPGVGRLPPADDPSLPGLRILDRASGRPHKWPLKLALRAPPRDLPAGSAGTPPMAAAATCCTAQEPGRLLATGDDRSKECEKGLIAWR